MARDVVLGFDVGATNTRARIGVLAHGGVRPHPGFDGALTTEASSKRALYDFVVSVLRVLEDTDVVEAATFAVAGPIEGGVRAKMTNWAEESPIELPELYALGLPSGRISLINDLYAGARGLTAWLEGPIAAGGLETLHPGSGPEGQPLGHLVFIAPGTGLGAAGIVRTSEPGRLPVACEAQHTLVPPFDAEAADVIAQLSEGPSGPPSWEDIASGVGLMRTYLAYCTLRGQAPRLSDAAGGSKAVAEAALSGSDPAAVSTLNLYYRVIGRFAQMLALTYQPCQAVYIGGASTIRNREFIRRTALVDQFLDNRAQSRLLADIPVHLVLEEVNLDGALAEAARLAKSRTAVGV